MPPHPVTAGSARRPRGTRCPAVPATVRIEPIRRASATCPRALFEQRTRRSSDRPAHDWGYRSHVLFLATDPVFADHDTGARHPERPARLAAVGEGLERSGLGTDLIELGRRVATRTELERVHPAMHLDRLEQTCAAAGHFDADTPGSPGSWPAVQAAAGAGLAAVDALTIGGAAGAFLAVRPPGHHARATQAMGFCLVNNVAIVAADLRARGRRVAVVDIDAHHGNGTQEIFYEDPDVLYVSFHEWPLYPGTGRYDERGAGAGAGATCNVPLPAGATGDVYLGALDRVVEPLLAGFGADWLLISAGFDAHRDDPITGLGLSAGDYAALIGRLRASVAYGRTVAFLEGGYSLSGLRDCVAASIPVLAGAPAVTPVGEEPTSGGPGDRMVAIVQDLSAPTGSDQGFRASVDAPISAPRAGVAGINVEDGGCSISIRCCVRPSSEARPMSTSRWARPPTFASTAS